MTEHLAGRLDEALRNEEPESALHDVVQGLLTEGHHRGEVSAVLEEYRGRLLGTGRDDGDELVLDIMAVLDGWASVTAVRQLLPKPCVAPQAQILG